MDNICSFCDLSFCLLICVVFLESKNIGIYDIVTNCHLIVFLKKSGDIEILTGDCQIWKAVQGLSFICLKHLMRGMRVGATEPPWDPCNMCLMRISPLQKLFYCFHIDLKVKVANQSKTKKKNGGGTAEPCFRWQMRRIGLCKYWNSFLIKGAYLISG